MVAVFLLMSDQRAARCWLLSAIFMFIWNGALFTIPVTIAENLYLLVAASCTIERSMGMS